MSILFGFGSATGYLATAPQSRLQGYDPLVMSKILMLRDAARLNPFKTKNFVFLDSGHMCATEIRPGEMPVFEKHLDKVNTIRSDLCFHVLFLSKERVSALYTCKDGTPRSICLKNYHVAWPLLEMMPHAW